MIFAPKIKIIGQFCMLFLQYFSKETFWVLCSPCSITLNILRPAPTHRIILVSHDSNLNILSTLTLTNYSNSNGLDTRSFQKHELSEDIHD